MPFLRIIHGKGTGALRQALREYLNGHPAIRDVETAPMEQGGGVTRDASSYNYLAYATQVIFTEYHTQGRRRWR